MRTYIIKREIAGNTLSYSFQCDRIEVSRGGTIIAWVNNIIKFAFAPGIWTHLEEKEEPTPAPVSS